jgi:hypothetical protein
LPSGQEFCEAFPNGIPGTIVNGNVDHTTAFQGDGGIHWELKPGYERIHEQYLERRRLDAGLRNS